MINLRRIAVVASLIAASAVMTPLTAGAANLGDAKGKLNTLGQKLGAPVTKTATNPACAQHPVLATATQSATLAFEKRSTKKIRRKTQRLTFSPLRKLAEMLRRLAAA